VSGDEEREPKPASVIGTILALVIGAFCFVPLWASRQPDSEIPLWAAAIFVPLGLLGAIGFVAGLFSIIGGVPLDDEEISARVEANPDDASSVVHLGLGRRLSSAGCFLAGAALMGFDIYRSPQATLLSLDLIGAGAFFVAYVGIAVLFMGPLWLRRWVLQAIEKLGDAPAG